MPNIKEVSILDLARGAIMEQIEAESIKLMQNIVDPNTDAKAARRLTVTVVLKPDENREIVSCQAQAKATLAPIKAINASLIVGTDKDGKPVATELTKDDPNQVTMFEEPEVKVLKLRVAN